MVLTPFMINLILQAKNSLQACCFLWLSLLLLC